MKLKEFHVCKECGYEKEMEPYNSIICCPICSKAKGEAVLILNTEAECPKCGKRMKYHIKPYNDYWKCKNIFCRYKSKNLYRGMEAFYEFERKYEMTPEQEAELREREGIMRVHI